MNSFKEWWNDKFKYNYNKLITDNPEDLYVLLKDETYCKSLYTSFQEEIDNIICLDLPGYMSDKYFCKCINKACVKLALNLSD